MKQPLTTIVLVLMFWAYAMFAVISYEHVHASEGGGGVSWEMEMQRPEARKALKKYVEENCSATLWFYDIHAVQGNNLTHLKLTCLTEK